MENKMNVITLTITSINFESRAAAQKPQALTVFLGTDDVEFVTQFADPELDAAYWNLFDLEREYETLLRIDATSPTGEVWTNVECFEAWQLTGQGWVLALVNDTEAERAERWSPLN